VEKFMSSSSNDNLKAIAQIVVGQLLKQDFKGVRSRFDSQMESFSEEKLKESWEKVVVEAGTLMQILPAEVTEQNHHRIIIIKCQFQRFNVDIQMVFNEKEQITGLFFMPVNMPYHAPEYVAKSLFHELDVTVGTGKWALPGTLTLPEGPGPFPCVILVHGSGPNDRDETIGPNQPFHDLAWGLASQGVSVLRYDKRTFKYAKEFTAQEINEMTVKEEVIDDAQEAVHLMHNTESIDPKNIFVLGHSLGATVMPRISIDQDLAGVIMMAGITRSLEDTILDQLTYLYNLTGSITEEQKQELETLKMNISKLKDPELVDTMSSQDMPLGIPMNYWKDLRDNNPVDIVKDIKMPILILQGGRDYQVLEAVDFEGWKKALNTNKNASFKVFPKLNHLFITGEGKSTPQEYAVEGHVDKDVIDVLVKWIFENIR
jgi:dienelactone hydrolase